MATTTYNTPFLPVSLCLPACPPVRLPPTHGLPSSLTIPPGQPPALTQPFTPLPVGLGILSLAPPLPSLPSPPVFCARESVVAALGHLLWSNSGEQMTMFSFIQYPLGSV